MQSEDIRKKSVKTCEERYGVQNVSYKDLDPQSVDILTDKEKFISFLSSYQFKPNMTEVANDLHVSCSTISSRAHILGITELFDLHRSNKEKEIAIINFILFIDWWHKCL